MWKELVHLEITMGFELIINKPEGLPKKIVDMALLAAVGMCPCCSKEINSLNEFRDEISLKEHRISGMCQNCQDSVFGE